MNTKSSKPIGSLTYVPISSGTNMFVCSGMADVPEEVALLLVGHANMKMIHEVYMTLKPK